MFCVMKQIVSVYVSVWLIETLRGYSMFGSVGFIYKMGWGVVRTNRLEEGQRLTVGKKET